MAEAGPAGINRPAYLGEEHPAARLDTGAKLGAMTNIHTVSRQQDDLQRLYNLVAALAHPKGDHRENEAEDEAHDIIRELRAQRTARDQALAALPRYTTVGMAHSLLDATREEVDAAGLRRAHYGAWVKYEDVVAALLTHEAP